MLVLEQIETNSTIYSKHYILNFCIRILVIMLQLSRHACPQAGIKTRIRMRTYTPTHTLGCVFKTHGLSMIQCARQCNTTDSSFHWTLVDWNSCSSACGRFDNGNYFRSFSKINVDRLTFCKTKQNIYVFVIHNI